VKRDNIPNIISLARMILVLPIFVLLVRERFVPALLLFAIAGISDGVDGYLAKRYHWTSRLGSVLDPLADKLLLTSSYVALAWVNLLPIWLAVTVIARDLIILTGAVAYHFLIGHLEMSPTVVSKINTTAQIVLVGAVLINGVWDVWSEMLEWLIVVVGTTTVISGMDYVWNWGKRAYRTRGHHRL